MVAEERASHLPNHRSMIVPVDFLFFSEFSCFLQCFTALIFAKPPEHFDASCDESEQSQAD